MLMKMCVPKFGIYQSIVAQIVLRTTQTLDVLICFKKKKLMFDLQFIMSDVTSFLSYNLFEL